MKIYTYVMLYYIHESHSFTVKSRENSTTMGLQEKASGKLLLLWYPHGDIAPCLTTESF